MSYYFETSIRSIVTNFRYNPRNGVEYIFTMFELFLRILLIRVKIAVMILHRKTLLTVLLTCAMHMLRENAASSNPT